MPDYVRVISNPNLLLHSSMENEDTINGTSEAQASEAVANQHLACHLDGGGGQEDANAVNGNEYGEPAPSDRRKEILKALEAVERDSSAIAESFSSLFSSLRLSLSQVAKFYLLTFDFSSDESNFMTSDDVLCFSFFFPY